jgi:hypothetical protein
VRELAAEYGVSLGAAHAALAELEADRAIRVERRGRSGAHVVDQSIGRLWLAAEGGPLVAALPLPTTLVAEGLATALKTVLDEAGLPAFIIFLRGSRRRLQTLPGGPGRGQPLRVLVDRESGDLQRLTELEFAGQAVELVPAPFLHFAALLASGQAQAVIWDTDEAELRLAALPVSSRPLSARVLETLRGSNTRASLVGNRDEPATAAVVARCLGGPRLAQLQREVMAGQRAAEY